MFSATLTIAFVSVLFPNFLDIEALTPKDIFKKFDPSRYMGDLKIQSINMSRDCSQQLSEYLRDLSQMKMWALKMFDASGKIPSGILEGNFYELGSFDECINIEQDAVESKIVGKYCIGKIPFPNAAEKSIIQPLAISVGLCLPSACTTADFQNIYNGIGMTVAESSCQTKESQYQIDVGTTIVLVLLTLWLCWVLFCTIYDMTRKVPSNWFIVSFSFYTNWKKVFATTKSDDEISSMHGIRVISMMWVILGHQCLGLTRVPIRNTKFILDFVTSRVSMIIIGATNAVDTFFFISGLTLSYVFVTYSKRAMKFNLLVYYLHRYIRLTPVVGFMILLHLFVLKHVGSGPLWPTTVEVLSEPCRKNWWKALLYIQNYDLMNDMCLDITWFLSIDMQLYILSPLLLLPLLQWPKLAIATTGCFAICSMLISFLVTWFLKIDHVADTNEYMKYYYLTTYCRAAPWLLGIIFGYLIYHTKNKKTIVIPKIYVVVLWVAAIAILLTCLVPEYDVLTGKHNSILEYAFNNAFQRSAWAICVGWVIYACQFGYGGVVNVFLSCTIFKVLSRLTFSAYLCHMFIQALTFERHQINPVINTAFLLETIWTNYAMVFFASLVLTLTLESPLISIEKRLLRKPSRVVVSNGVNHESERGHP